MSTKSGCGGKQFPLNTKGCCFICLKLIRGKANSTSLVDLYKYLEIDMRQVYQKSLSSKNLPNSTAAEEFEKAETRGQLCPKCRKLIVESVECYRQLELIEIRRKNCLKAILECFKEEVKSKLGEDFRRMMTSDKFASPYLAIVTELRKQIGIKCSSQVGGSTCATPNLTKSHSVRQGHQASRKAYVNVSNATRRNIQIKESQLITVPTSLPTQTFTEEVSEGEEIEILEAAKEEVKEEQISTSPPLIEIASDDEDMLVKEEDNQATSDPDPLEEPEPAPVFSITAPPLTTSVVSTTSGIPCKICKAQVICSSFQDLRQHYTSFHPKVKLATKCNLCGKFFEGKHENCQGRPVKKKSTSVARARRFLQSKQSLKRKKVALETAQAPSPLNAKAKRKRKSSPQAKRPKREPSEKKKRSGKVKSEVPTPKLVRKRKVKVNETPVGDDKDSPRPPRVRKPRVFNWKNIDPSKFEVLPDSTLKCTTCSKIFIRREFRRHFYRRHFKHSCDICDDKFSQKSLLERHKQVIHLGIGSYQKQRPGFVNVWDPIKEARRKPALPKTPKEKPNIFMCEHGCGETFRYQYKRQQHHDKVHLGVKYMCDACGKCFADDVCLKGHKRSMHGEGGEKYACDVCGKRYYDQSRALEHKRSMHEGQKFSCQVPGCTSVVKWKSNLIHHMKKFHPDYSTKPVPNDSNEEPSKN